MAAGEREAAPAHASAATRALEPLTRSSRPEARVLRIDAESCDERIPDCSGSPSLDAVFS